MSKVTLETLRADYLAAKQEVLDLSNGVERLATDINPAWFRISFIWTLRVLKLVAQSRSVRHDATGKSVWTSDDLRRKAMIYSIARKQGLEAAMLWKLAN